MLEYFGQSDSIPCGTCDVCNGDHESGIKFADFTRIRDKIKNTLPPEGLPIEKMIRLIAEPEPNILKVSRWMLDNDLLIAGSNGLLTNNYKNQ